jgi:3-oxoacyl-(acyl-carrier-protein) synthase
MRRVVVTGLGVVSPNGVGVNAFLQALGEGMSGIRFQPRLNELNFTCQVMGLPQVDDETLSSVLNEEQIRATNSCMKFTALAGVECWRDAGMPWEMGARNRPVDWGTGVVFGNGVGGMDTIAERVVPLTSSGQLRRLGSTAAEQTMSSNTSALLGGLLGVGGQVASNSSACATGTEAVINAFRQIRHGYADRVLAGAAESSSEFTAACFDCMRVTARGFNATPERASRPLSATASGFVPAAGAGALLLESLESAEGRGARIYAEVVGAAMNCGGQRDGGSITAANPEGVRRCLRQALEQSQMTGAAIDYINGHLTATGADPREIENLSCALSVDHDDFPWINSTKSMIGHALGASGAIECVATILQLHHSFIHPSINCEDLHPSVARIASRVVQVRKPASLRTALKTSFGFGDVNACIVFSRWNGGQHDSVN